jgi:hypothetical protein
MMLGEIKMIYGHVPQQVIRYLAFLLISLLPLTSFAQNQVFGSMDCVVTGNVVISSEEGKFKQYSGFKDSTQVGDKATFEYWVGDKNIYLGLGGKLLEKTNEKTIINTSIATSRKKNSNPTTVKGFHIETEYEEIWLTEDYISINTSELGDLNMKRYFKNDWHGIYSFYERVSMSSQTATINCRHTKDEMNSAYDIFLKFWNTKK